MGKVTEKHKRARRADSCDTEVGRRVRSRRLERRLSQTELADGIGITFQQVQKYEKGTNRIGAGRLQRIAKKLGVPILFFFDNMDGTTASRDPKKGKDSVFELMQTSGAIRIVKSAASLLADPPPPGEGKAEYRASDVPVCGVTFDVIAPLLYRRQRSRSSAG